MCNVFDVLCVFGVGICAGLMLATYLYRFILAKYFKAIKGAGQLISIQHEKIVDLECQLSKLLAQLDAPQGANNDGHA